MALWAGRFKKEINENVNAFNSSISFVQECINMILWGALLMHQCYVNRGLLMKRV